MRADCFASLFCFQDPIRKPMLATLDKSVKNQACELFRLVQIYMSDRKPKPGMTLNSVGLDIVNMCYNTVGLRDELFVQICRQTTENHKRLVYWFQVLLIGIRSFIFSLDTEKYAFAVTLYRTVSRSPCI